MLGILGTWGIMQSRALPVPERVTRKEHAPANHAMHHSPAQRRNILESTQVCGRFMQSADMDIFTLPDSLIQP